MTLSFRVGRHRLPKHLGKAFLLVLICSISLNLLWPALPLLLPRPSWLNSRTTVKDATINSYYDGRDAHQPAALLPRQMPPKVQAPPKGQPLIFGSLPRLDRLTLEVKHFVGHTWTAVAKEVQNIDTIVVDKFAVEFWRKISSPTGLAKGYRWIPPFSATLVAVIWVKGEGVFAGTIPHDGATENDDNRNRNNVQGQFEDFLCLNAPDPNGGFRYRFTQEYEQGTLDGRKISDWRREQLARNYEKEPNLWHAEDMAAYTYEKWREDQELAGRRFVNPKYFEAYITVFGKKSDDSETKFWDLCGPTSDITPSCQRVFIYGLQLTKDPDKSNRELLGGT